MTTSRFLVSTDWLTARLGDNTLAIVDASWHLPAAKRDGFAEYQTAHIPGAVFFDIDKIADTASGLPHMLPSAGVLSSALGNMGISEQQDIVVYDGAGLFSAPRVWWMLRVFGARNVFILDGGFPAWLAERRPTENGIPQKTPAIFHAVLDQAQVKDAATVEAVLESGSAEILDARPAERFRGEAAEPRPGVRAGHIPGSKNLPFGQIVRDGRLASVPEIRAALETAEVDLNKPVITSCGSGVSAAILALALDAAGTPVAGIYDGSWTEWGSRLDLPVATGEA